MTVRRTCFDVPAIRPAGISHDFGSCVLSLTVARQVYLRVPPQPHLYLWFVICILGGIDCRWSQSIPFPSFIPYSPDKVKHFSENQSFVKFTYSPLYVLKKLLWQKDWCAFGRKNSLYFAWRFWCICIMFAVVFCSFFETISKQWHSYDCLLYVHQKCDFANIQS